MSDSDGMLDMNAIEQDALNNNFGIAGQVIVGGIEESIAREDAAGDAGNNAINAIHIIIPDTFTRPSAQDYGQLSFDEVSRRFCQNPRDNFNTMYPDIRNINVFADNLRAAVLEIARFFDINPEQLSERPGSSQEAFASTSGTNEHRVQTYSEPVASTSGLRSNETRSLAPVASTSGLHESRNQTASAPVLASMSRACSQVLHQLGTGSSSSVEGNASDNQENQLGVLHDFAGNRVDFPIVINVFINNAAQFIKDMKYFSESLDFPIYVVRMEGAGTITGDIERILYDDVVQLIVTSGFEEFSPEEGHRYTSEDGVTHVIIHLDYNALHDIGFSVVRVLRLGQHWKKIKLTYFKEYVR